MLKQILIAIAKAIVWLTYFSIDLTISFRFRISHNENRRSRKSSI